MRWSSVSSSACSPVTAKYRCSTTSLYSDCNRARRSWNSAICCLSFIFSDDVIVVLVRSWLEPGPAPAPFAASSLARSRFSSRSLHSRAVVDTSSITPFISSLYRFIVSVRVAVLDSSFSLLSFTSFFLTSPRMDLTVATSAKNASILETPPPGVGAAGGASSSAGGGAVACSKGSPLASGRDLAERAAGAAASVPLTDERRSFMSTRSH
mmetsp:Transcript_6378/g.28082  ORF Transcript_6378/g.28082 Transcript_6378/m.28082 type:complete len:210 (+) Transcript_6378:1151-1780(+)